MVPPAGDRGYHSFDESDDEYYYLPCGTVHCSTPFSTAHDCIKTVKLGLRVQLSQR